MVAAIKLAVPVLSAAILAVHQLTGGLAGPPIGLTNLSGAVGDCTTPAANAVCASLFKTAGEPLYPGGPVQTAKVTITYHAPTPTSSFGVYLSNFAARGPQSAPFCSASDPAAMLDLTLRQGTRTVYRGTLSGFAGSHSGPASMLHLAGGPDGSAGLDRWRDGDSSTFEFEVAVDGAAGNDYMGCASTADIDWLAAQ